MIQQPTAQSSAPQPPAAPSGPLSAQDQAELAQGLRQAQAASQQVQHIVQQVQREQAGRQQAQTVVRNGSGSVITDGSGGIVVTGADGRTITIPAHTELDGDQIQQLVEHTLQPATPPSPEFPRELIPISAIVFPCLAAIVYFITRMFTRRAPAGSTVAALAPEAAARLARIEQAVEAVAIEVERISEAQRYSAQLLTDRLVTPNGAGTVTAHALPLAGGIDRG